MTLTPPAASAAAASPSLVVWQTLLPSKIANEYQEVGLGSGAPQEIVRSRRQTMDMLRKSGQPVVVKHRFNLDDIDAGVARECPACIDDDLGWTRGDCPVCFTVGFVSVEEDPNNWIDLRGRIITSSETGIPAPLYGGYGASSLTWMIEPDVSVDVYKPDERGALVRTQQAQGYAPWFPTLGDNDLCINVDVEPDGTIINTNERFELKMVQPRSIRGWGAKTVGQVHLVWQEFEMSRTPKGTFYYNVPV